MGSFSAGLFVCGTSRVTKGTLPRLDDECDRAGRPPLRSLAVLSAIAARFIDSMICIFSSGLDNLRLKQGKRDEMTFCLPCPLHKVHDEEEGAFEKRQSEHTHCKGKEGTGHDSGSGGAVSDHRPSLVLLHC